MSKTKALMKRVVPIVIFILILTIRQEPPAHIVGHKQLCGLLLQDTNFFIGIQGPGWTEDVDKGDPKEIPLDFQSFQNEEYLFIGAFVLNPFPSLSHTHSNPLLIDLPPPIPGA